MTQPELRSIFGRIGGTLIRLTGFTPASSDQSPVDSVPAEKVGVGPVVKQNESQFDILPGHFYRLYGAKEESEILTDCGFCGGQFNGPVQSACDYCGQSRPAYLVDVTQADPADQMQNGGDENEIWTLPVVGGEKVVMGKNCRRGLAVGREIYIGDGGACSCMIAQTIEAGNDVEAELVVADTISAYTGFKGNTLLGRQIVLGSKANVDCIVVLDNGSLNLTSAESYVGAIYLGRNVSVTLGYGTEVGYIGFTDHYGQTVYDDVSIEEDERIARRDYLDKIKEILTEASETIAS